ncbi:helicase-related protein, partial [Halopenitus sp. H-Gu1]|uniref:helicase-related protein n=1 Tax=Halopenitus sp. H-Gu1 TaxID=3242697 RepID=UPI00359E1FF0
DQYERLEELCDACDLPVHRWHGDVSSNKKSKALDEPGGVLLITPESVEALFLRRPSVFRQALQNVSYVVVDEVHAFIGTPRGKQVQSLLHRVERAKGEWIPRVALSATIGDHKITAEFLRPNAGAEVEIIDPDGDRQEIRLLVKGYENKNTGSNEEDEEEPSGTVVDIAEQIFTTLRGQDNLVFANRRMDVELYTDLLKRVSEDRGVPNEFYAHHGSLSKEIREESERLLKKSGTPATVICTSTLELGIDIGWMDSIGQIGSPPSVSSMRQRLGRSGREDDPAVLRVYIQEPEITDSTPLEDTLRPELVQTIAMVDLLLEKWYEPPNLDALELSTFIQQLLSLVAEHGGIKTEAAYRILCQTGPFDTITIPQFKLLLRGLADEELLSQAGDGDLIMGLTGEKVTRHYDFYAAFWSPDEYRLVANEKTIGTLPVTSPLVDGKLLIFGGQRWEVESVDQEKQIAFLKSAPGGKVPKFGGEGALVHTRVREEMFSTYTSTVVPRYLDTEAVDLLEEGRVHFERLDLENQNLIRQGAHTILFVWAGDRVMNTIHLLLAERGYKASKAGMTLQVQNCQPAEVLEELCEIASLQPAEPAALAESVENKIVDKHDRYLPEELLNLNYASNRLDIEGALNQINAIVSNN